MNKKTKKASKFMSLLLRHSPETIGLELDNSGWARISDLISLTESHDNPLTLPLILEAVETNDKQRFSISSEGLRIRANQGHSLQVELNLKTQQPPAKLYHGTATRFLNSILSEGLTKQNRQHVHLTDNVDTARKVGVRHGKLALLEVDAGEMHSLGKIFYCSENGVWLTESVPADFISEVTP